MSVCSGCQHDSVCKYKKQVQNYEKRTGRDRGVPEPLRPELVCRYKLTSNGWPYYIYYPIYEPYRVVYGTGNGAGNESPVPLCEVTCDSADTISAVPCSDITPVNKGDTEFLNYMERTWQQQR